MTRPLDASLAAEIVKPAFQPIAFVQADFAGGANPTPSLFVWTGVGTISWNGHTWSGLGELLSIGPIQENAVLRADGIQITLSAIPQYLLNEALLYTRLSKRLQVWAGALDASGNVIGTPFPAWAGRVDAVTLNEGGDTATLTVNGENELLRMLLALNFRWTDLEQQQRFSGDLGFAYLVALQDWNGSWGPGTGLRQVGEAIGTRMEFRKRGIGGW